jgi:hypothetical protein
MYSEKIIIGKAELIRHHACLIKGCPHQDRMNLKSLNDIRDFVKDLEGVIKSRLKQTQKE